MIIMKDDGQNNYNKKIQCCPQNFNRAKFFFKFYLKTLNL